MIARARLPVLLVLVLVATGCASATALPPPAPGAPRGCWNREPASIDPRPTFSLFCLQTP